MSLVVPALALTGVVKRYGTLTAVDHLDLAVPEGICLGLLGPNGAGKSTTMKMLTGQVLADEGAIAVHGVPVPQQSKAARALMGVVPQNDNLDEELTCAENLLVWATLQRIPRARRQAAIADALAIAALEDRATSKVRALSGGMRRRLLIARGLVHNPRLILLDEPTVGLDPQVRAEIWVIIDRLRNEGATVVMSTHYIEEAERLADDVAIMHRGRIIARDAPAVLLANYVGTRALEYYGPPARLEEIEAAVRFSAPDQPMRRTGPSVSILRAESLSPSLRAALDPFGPATERAATLEDVFVLLTGEVLE